MDLLIIFGHSHLHFLAHVGIRDFAGLSSGHFRRAFGKVGVSKVDKNKIGSTITSYLYFYAYGA